MTPRRTLIFKKISLGVLCLFSAFPFCDAATGFFGDGSGGAIFYTTNGSTSGAGTYSNVGSLNNLDYGDFSVGSSNLLLRGGEAKTFKNSGGDVTAVNQFYRVFLLGSAAGNFTSFSLPFNSDLGSGNQMWQKIDQNVNLLSGLTTSGRYVVQYYWEQLGNQGTQYLNNGGSNYSTYFDLFYLINTSSTVTQNTTGGAASLTGNGTFVKQGSGTVQINANNSGYSGNVFVDQGTVEFQSGSFLTSGSITLGPESSANTGTLSISDSDGGTNISNTIVVRANGAGSSIGATNSSGTNSYSGSIYLDGGASTSITSGGSLSFNGTEIDTKAQTLTITGSGNTTISALIRNTIASGNLVKNGTGTLTIAGSSANTFNGMTTLNNGTTIFDKVAGTNAVSGGVTINSGATLQTNSANQIGSNFVTVNSGGTFNLNNNPQILALAGAGNVALGSATMTISNGGSDTFSGTISGSGGVTKAGVGTQILSGANSYDGTTTISAGTLEAQHANALGSSANGTTVSSGAVLKLYHATGITIANETLNITGAAVGGAFVNTGGNNTWSGAVTLSGNTRINADTTGANGSLTISGNIAGGANALLLGSQGGSLGRTGGDITLSGSVSGAGAALGSHGNTTTSILKDGLGALTLSGSSSFSGATLLNNGTILVGNNNAFGTGLLQVHWQDASSSKTIASTDNSTRTLSNALNIYSDFTLGASDRTGSMVFNGPINLGEDAGSRTVTTANGTSHTFGGNISSGNTAGGPRTLIKAGGGELVLAGTNSGYNATIFVNAGTLSAASNNNLNNGTIQLGSGATSATLAITGGDTVRTQGIAIADSSTAGAISITSGTTYMNGTLSQTGGNASTKIGKSGAGTLYLGSANSYQGQIQVGQGNVILGNNTASGTNTSTANRGFDLGLNVGDVSQANNVGLYVTNGVTSNASIYVSPNTGNATRTLGLSGSGSGTFSNEIYMDGNTTLSGGSGTLTISGRITHGATARGVIVSDGTVALSSSASNYNGTTAISGGTLRVDNANALGSGGTISFSGGTLRYGTGITTDFSSRFSSAANQAYAVDTNGNNVAFASALSSSGGSLTKNGTGALTLNAQNTYNGTTTVNAGTLALGHATNTLADSSSVVVAGGELSLGSNTETVASFAISNGTLAGSGNLTAATYALQGGTVAANLGTGTANVATGTTTLNGALAANTVNINSGNLTLGAADRLDNTANVTVSGGTLNLGANSDTVGSLTLNGTLAGTGTLTAATYALQGGTVNAGLGNGSVAVSTGTTALGSAGRLHSGSTVAINSGQLTLGGNETVSGFALNSGTLGGNGTLTASVYDLQGGTVAANLGTGTANVATGTTTLNGALASNTVNINSGNLTLGAANRLADGATVSVSGGSLNSGSHAQTVAALNISSGSINGSGTITATTYGLSGGTVAGALGAGTANVTGAVALSGTMNSTALNILTGGNLSLSSSNRIGSGSVDINGGTLSMGSFDDTVGAVTLRGGGTLAGSGTLTGSSFDLQGGTVNAALGNATVTVSTGTTTLGSANRLNSGSSLAINSGQLNLGGAESVGALSGSGGTLNLGANTLTTSVSAGSSTFSGTITGTGGGLTKAGAGELILTGASDYSGATTVSAGTLRVNGSLGATAVSVGNAATLGGNATIGGLVTLNSGGTLSPGNSIGTMNFSAGLTLNSTSTVRMEISATNGSADQINITGGIMTRAGDLIFDTVSMGSEPNNTYTLFTGNQTGSWGMVSVAGPYTGNFTNNSGVWTRNTGDGTLWTYDQSLGTLTVVPEPSTWALIGVGSAFILWRLRRRKA